MRTTKNKWAVVYRHTEGGKHVLRISNTYKTKQEATDEAKTDKLYEIMLAVDAQNDHQYLPLPYGRDNQ